MESANLSFHGLIPPWLGIAIAVLSGAAVFHLYWREHGKIGSARRAVMAILRVGVIGTALFLLMRPVLVAETRGEKPRSVALIIDNSLSMTQKDQRLSAHDRLRVAIASNLVPPETAMPAPDASVEVPPQTPENPSRAEIVKAILAHPKLRILEGLEKGGPLKVYLAGQRLRSLEDEAVKPGQKPSESLSARLGRSLTHDETRTALADSIHDLLSRSEGDLPSWIVVMTDGQDNASRLTLDEAAAECARWKVPLHIYGVGSSEVGNLEIKDFAAPDTIFFDDTVSIPVRWRCRGFKKGSAQLTLSLGKRVVAQKELVLTEGEDFRDVLSFTPRKSGAGDEKDDLVVSIQYRGAETFTEDNQMKRPVSIVDRKVKILYIEGSPRWEYKFLQSALLRDRRVEAKFLPAIGDRRTLLSGNPYLPAFPATRQELFAFDVLILGDVPATFIGTERTGWIRDFVREGGSLIVIAGRQNLPSGYHGSPLAEVLPVEFAPMKAAFNDLERTQPWQPVLTRAGERSEMLSLADTPEESARAWQTLPGFHWSFPVTKLRAGATALLVHPRLRAGDQLAPVLAAQFYGKGQVVFLGTDETWRWRYNQGEKIYSRFWGQVIYQMGLPHLIGTPKRVQLSLERPENVLGKPGYVYARVFDAEFRAFTGEKIVARLERLDAKPGEERARTLFLEPVTGQPGDYRALLAHDAVGRFAVKVDDPATSSLEYRVSLPPQHELTVAGLAEDSLRAAAQASSGKFYREEDLHRMLASLEPRKAPYTMRSEMLLWNAPVFLIFLGLIAAEWILRKFSNLS
jgi:uncharacterized membrane protein